MLWNSTPVKFTGFISSEGKKSYKPDRCNLILDIYKYLR